MRVTPVYRLPGKLLRSSRCAYWHVVSPILLCGNWYVKVEDKLSQFLENVIEKTMGLQPCGHIKGSVLPMRAWAEANPLEATPNNPKIFGRTL